jgi:hypothetical protein
VTYTVSYGRWVAFQLTGAVLGTAWVVGGALRAERPAMLPFVLVFVGAIWWVSLRGLVTRVDLAGRTLVVHTPVRTLQMSADEARLAVPRFWYANLRGPDQMRGFDLPNTRDTKELARLIRES